MAARVGQGRVEVGEEVVLVGEAVEDADALEHAGGARGAALEEHGDAAVLELG